MNHPTILIFFPNNCFPPLHGSHHRCIQQIEDLRHSYRLYYASSRDSSDTPWPVDNQACTLSAKQYGIQEVFLFEDSLAGRVDHILGVVIWKFYLATDITFFKRLRLLIQKWIMTLWFGWLAISLKPLSVIIHYTKWGFLSQFIRSPVKAIELHDVLPVQNYLVSELRKLFQSCNPKQLLNQVPWPWYIDRSNQLPINVIAKIHRDNYALNRFDLVWMISKREQYLLQNLGLSSRSVIIYPSISTNSIADYKTIPPLLPLGPNIFNAYSMLRFISDVIPLIDVGLEQQAEILVTGSLGYSYPSIDIGPPMKHIGFVDDYLDLLSKSCLMLAPTAVGTGQQVKIFEALSVGTPVLAYKSAVPDDILANNPCIIAAEDESQFAGYLSEFIKNKQLRIKYARLAAKSSADQARVIASRPYTHSLRASSSQAP
jgi:glycosyltransferase involved in cell wall biosynthesis